jgi:hypothetical protein
MVYMLLNQGDMVAISHKNPLDDEDGVFEGVVMERARRCLLSFMNSLFNLHT